MAKGLIAELKAKGVEFSHVELKQVGFHGTTEKRATRILATGFDMSQTDSRSWLGGGFYFFDNANTAGSKYALCFAKKKYADEKPAVLQADLFFKSLLDLTEKNNKAAFWQIHRLLRDQATRDEVDTDVDEQFIAHYIGTQVAPLLGCDGVGWEFPLSEPEERRKPAHKKQPGFAVKKLGAITRVIPHKIVEK